MMTITTAPIMAMAKQLPEDVDIVVVAVREVLDVVPCTAEQRHEIERRIDDLKRQVGGRRHYVPKSKKHPDADTRRAAFEAMKDASRPIEQIVSDTGLSRPTLYRLMKRDVE